MKYIRIEHNIVQEIIPAIDPVFPEFPIEERYPARFLSTCIPVADETVVEQNWLYDETTGMFSAPPQPEPIQSDN